MGRKPGIDARRVEDMVALREETESVVVVKVGETHGALKRVFSFEVVVDGGVEEDGEVKGIDALLLDFSSNSPQMSHGSPSPVRGNFDECVYDQNHSENVEGPASDDEASCSRGTRQSDGWTSSEDEAETMEQVDEDKSLSFKAHRRAHYDEFLKVKELRQKASLLEDGSDEDNTELTEREKEHDSFSLAGAT
ncbi:Protein phosphatase inhibitor 2 [Sesbania bispinosa]|nr:Protein phosphatase inhibitor 2 [Sesbania bispinosa]